MLHYYFLSIALVLLFLHGFFPIPNNLQTFDNKPPLNLKDYEFNETYKSEIKRTVLIIIDALRLDFATPHLMPKLTQILNNNPKSCFNQITVESPTVTLPRIKAITTGCVPQFIDVVTNLASAQILEDSLIHSAIKANKNVVFYGDDTWLRLFPKQFHRSEGTTSFYVNDFTSVDDNVTRNVHEELGKTDWDVMILHYLGLDHIGHVFGPFSPLIPGKLREMDEVISEIYDKLNGGLLVVTGDHGMRDSGGHGGATYAEKNVPFIMVGVDCVNDSFAQTDIPVNLAALLGIDIPSSSIGSLKASMLASFSKEKYLFALRYNALFLLQKNQPSFCRSNMESAANSHLSFLHDNDESGYERAKKVYERCSELIASDLLKAAVKQNLSSLIIATLMMFDVLLIFWLHFSLDTKRNLFEFCALALIAFLQIFSDKLKPLLILIIAGFIINNLRLFKYKLIVEPNGILILSVFHPLTFLASSYLEEEHQYWYFALTFLLIENAMKQLKYRRYKTSATLILLAIFWRFLRSLNQTGDKWAHWPDVSDWLLQAPNAIYLQLIFIAGLLSNFLTIVYLTRNKIEVILNLAAFGAIFVFKTVTVNSVLLGRLIWLLIAVLSLTFNRNNLRNSWILLASLLLKPHNLLLIAYTVVTGRYLTKMYKTSLINLSLTHLLLGNALYFAQGHSNSLASVDVSVGYIGLETYQPVLVFAQVLCHTYALPVLANFALFANREVMEDYSRAWTLQFFVRLLVMTVTCLATLLHRNHLFIWSVFAPKMFIEAAHCGILLVQVVFFTIYVKLFKFNKSGFV